ncbi:uncharacterized protein HMPREF1541_09386 [Cyphellophora europaea CBS 101466]|uniref:Copper homeostasis protein cutC homolog n=1 Tax=Cyphellophora europaea (strain CBS 101466) TaxID=1220924 RepID=W2SCA7_CYPE1|nr:uncharacterized protein HMPREF1541_09386 [Cyphellophora europaea CBS 101466]ETN45554.1 hypothetical protein HMPREF1541_09386 [Cyphellophora europaea CBS 101466]
MSVLLEVCAASLPSAIAAQDGGAARVELCSLLETGGITPSYGLIRATRKALHIPVHVLIRPRSGGFVYSDAEIEIIKHDIDIAGQLGCDGVVVGLLTSKQKVDPRVASLVDLAKRWGMSVTFHRAFDDVVDMHEGLEDVIKFGCDRVLTGGGQSTEEPSARARLRSLVEQAGEKIVIMPGAGVTSLNVESLLLETRAKEVHASCKQVLMSEASLFQTERWETDETTVREIVQVLARVS